MCLLFVSFLFRVSISDLRLHFRVITCLMVCCGVMIVLQFKTNEQQKKSLRRKLIFWGSVGGGATF